MDRYFREAGARLTLPYELVGGTALQRAVWLEIARIPYGETISYSTLAERVGFPRAIRAVASACGANPLPLVIPCHRVVRTDGALSGYRWGVERKRELLNLRVEFDELQPFGQPEVLFWVSRLILEPPQCRRARLGDVLCAQSTKAERDRGETPFDGHGLDDDAANAEGALKRCHFAE